MPKLNIEHWIDIRNNAVLSMIMYNPHNCTMVSTPILENIFSLEEGGKHSH